MYASGAFAVANRSRAENAKTEYLVDAAFCPICRWNHRYFEKYKKNEEYWNNWYRFSRPNTEFNRFPKGIIKINF